MEQFLFDNADHHRSLVSRWTPPKAVTSRTDAQTQPNPDMVVCARVRPLLDSEEETGVSQAIFERKKVNGCFDVHELRQGIKSTVPQLKSSNYTVDKGYEAEATTEEIFEDVVKPLVPWAWAGGIGTFFVYGQTGSGKTFTTTRMEELVAEQLMTMKGNRKVHLSITELAGNNAFDLLNNRRPVSILEDSFGLVQLAGALEHVVSDGATILQHIQTATSFRRTASTEKNDASSRSHAICRFRIEAPDVPSAEDGMLYLIDLAGSEAARDRRNHGGSRAAETRQINTSLSVLKDCIRGKAEFDSLSLSKGRKGPKSKPYIPFRQAALTKVLKHVFDPATLRTSKSVVMACVNPSLLDTGASKNTLRYAEMLRVLVPKTGDTREDPNVPVTWGNGMLKKWISIESGFPAIDADALAAQESGLSLLRLPAAEFELRCLKTPGVTLEQIQVFRSKFWQKHIDSKNPAKGNAKPEADEDAKGLETLLGYLNSQLSSSREPKEEAVKSVAFRERLRPGMVISYKPYKGKLPPGMEEKRSLAMLLSLEEASGPYAQSAVDERSSSALQEGASRQDRWLCAKVESGQVPMSYELHAWRHLVLHKEDMLAEVILEYDTATRYYFVAI